MGLLSRFFSKDKALLSSLNNMLGFYPSNINLYKSALRHRSAATEIKNGIKNSNERLEYLGDAILGAVVADYVFKKFPYKEEGFLTEMRSKIVSRESNNKLCRKLGLDALIQNNPDNSPNKSMHGDAFEALIGAIYLDKGYHVCRRFIIGRIIQHHLDIDTLENTETNFKSRLIEWAQRERKAFAFELAEESENGNRRLISIHAMVDGEVLGTGQDYSKKKAEQIAALDACKKLGIL